MTISNNEFIDLIWFPLTDNEEVLLKNFEFITHFIINHSFFKNIFIATHFCNVNTNKENVYFVKVENDYKTFFKSKMMLDYCSPSFAIIVGTDSLVDKLNTINKLSIKSKTKKLLLKPMILVPENKYIDDEIKIIEYINNNYWLKCNKKDKYKLCLNLKMNPKYLVINFLMLLFDYFPGFDTQKLYYIFDKKRFYLHYSDKIVNQLSLVTSLDYIEIAITCENLLKKDL